MVEFEQRIDRFGKIYIREPLRRAGFGEVVRITPNLRTAVMYPPSVTPEQIIESLKVLIKHFQQIAADPTHGECGSAQKPPQRSDSRRVPY